MHVVAARAAKPPAASPTINRSDRGRWGGP